MAWSQPWSCSRATHSRTPGSGSMPFARTSARKRDSFSSLRRRIRSGIGVFAQPARQIRSFRLPNDCTNCSCVTGRPSSAITSRHARQWNSAESTSVPSRSQSTASLCAYLTSVTADRGVHKTAAGAVTGGSGGRDYARRLYSVFVADPPRLEVTVTDAGLDGVLSVYVYRFVPGTGVIVVAG